WVGWIACYHKNVDICPKNYYVAEGNKFLAMRVSLTGTYMSGNGTLFLGLTQPLVPNRAYRFRGYFARTSTKMIGVNIGSINSISSPDLILKQIPLENMNFAD